MRDFSEERYVRVYTRKTITTKLLGWEGRMCLHALLLEVDRAGVLCLEGLAPGDALAAMADIPVELARIGMARLLEREVAMVEGDRLTLPRFREAQEARQSDAQRQRESRATRKTTDPSWSPTARITQPGPESHPVTERDRMTSQNVTVSHTESHGVTPCHSSLAEPSQTSLARSREGTFPESEAAVSTKAIVAGATNPKPKPKRARRAPEDWRPKPEHVSLAMQLGIPLEVEAQRFADHEFGAPKSDWDAAFRNWLRRSLEMRRTAAGARVVADRGADQLTRQMARIQAMEANSEPKPKALP